MTNKSHALSNRAGTDPTPDTNPNSTFWQGAPILIMDSDVYGKKVSGHRSEVRSRWTTTNLYFLFVCPYKELHLLPAPSTSAKTDGLWNWDVAEVFIGSVSEPIYKYKEFELSPQGEWLDLDIDLNEPDKIGVKSWSSAFEVAARIEPVEKTWYGFMRIPYAAVEEAEPAVGDTLRINFFRSQGPDHIEIAWQPSRQESFHAPEQFGLLRLIAE